MGFKARQTIPEERIFIRPGLELRTWTMDDAEALFALADKNRMYLRRWMSWLDSVSTVDEIRPFLQSCLDGYENGSSFRWALLIDGQIGGVLGLEAIEKMHKRAKIGYWQSEEHQGCGCITLAVRAVIDYGFSERKLNLLEIRAATENQKSRAVAGRVGMTYEGIFRQREWLYDHYVDHAVYTLLASEWILTSDKSSTK